MRIYLFIFCFLVGGAFLITNTKADAQTASSSTTTIDRTASSTPRLVAPRTASTSPQVEERLASSTERRTERQELRNERQVALSAQRQQRVLNLSANLSNRFDAAIDRFYNIIGRLEARITKLKDLGANTEAAEAELRQAAQHLADAKSTLATIDTLVQEATTSTEPQNRWLNVRETYQKAGASIRASHQALRNTISLLKAAAAEAELSRSATVSQATTTNE